MTQWHNGTGRNSAGLGPDCQHTNTMQSRNISRTLICLDCGKRDPFAQSNPAEPGAT